MYLQSEILFVFIIKSELFYVFLDLFSVGAIFDLFGLTVLEPARILKVEFFLVTYVYSPPLDSSKSEEASFTGTPRP